MKKYITYLLATALVGSAFVSCTERFQEGEMRVSTHKVHFSASEVETRTGKRQLILKRISRRT